MRDPADEQAQRRKLLPLREMFIDRLTLVRKLLDAQMCGEPCAQLSAVEGLRYVIARPRLEGGRHTLQVPLRGNHQDGKREMIVPLPDLPAHLQARHLRKHPVEQHDVRGRRLLLQGRQCRRTIRSDADIVARPAQERLEHIGRHRIVLGEEDDRAPVGRTILFGLLFGRHRMDWFD